MSECRLRVSSVLRIGHSEVESLKRTGYLQTPPVRTATSTSYAVRRVSGFFLRCTRLRSAQAESDRFIPTRHTVIYVSFWGERGIRLRHRRRTLCSADGSTHTESNKLYRKVKHRYRPNLSPRQRPTAKSRHDQAALAASAEARGATHRARPRSPSFSFCV